MWYLISNGKEIYCHIMSCDTKIYDTIQWCMIICLLLLECSWSNISFTQIYDSIPAVRYLPLPFQKGFQMFKVLYASCCCFGSLYGIILYQFPMTNMKTFFARCPMKDIWRCLLKTKGQEFRVSHGILLMPTWMNWRRWVLLMFYFLRY